MKTPESMPDQLELFHPSERGAHVIEAPVVGRITFAPKAPPLPTFAPGSETSRRAAIAKYDKGDCPNQREMIYRWIRFCGNQGATRDEIEIKLGLKGDTVRPRLKELLGEAKGFTVARIRKLKNADGGDALRKTSCDINAEVLVTI